jgi:hypothetical protein
VYRCIPSLTRARPPRAAAPPPPAPLGHSFTEAELIHGRWAMLGAAGALAVEALGYGNWVDAELTGGPLTYFGKPVRGVLARLPQRAARRSQRAALRRRKPAPYPGFCCSLAELRCPCRLQLPYDLNTVIFVEVLGIAWAESARQTQKDKSKVRAACTFCESHTPLCSDAALAAATRSACTRAAPSTSWASARMRRRSRRTRSRR